MKLRSCIPLNQSKEIAHKPWCHVLFLWFACLRCFGQLKALIFLCQSSHCWRESLQMQNDMSDGLLFYLAVLASVEMVRACVRVHVCVYTFHYVPSRRSGAAFSFFPIDF